MGKENVPQSLSFIVMPTQVILSRLNLPEKYKNTKHKQHLSGGTSRLLCIVFEKGAFKHLFNHIVEQDSASVIHQRKGEKVRL